MHMFTACLILIAAAHVVNGQSNQIDPMAHDNLTYDLLSTYDSRIRPPAPQGGAVYVSMSVFPYFLEGLVSV
jgi:hypothetical protein